MQSERRSFLRKLGLAALVGITGTVVTKQEAIARVVGKLQPTNENADRHFCYMYHYKEGIFPSETFLGIVTHVGEAKKDKILYKFSAFGVEQNTVDKINEMSLKDLLNQHATFSDSCLGVGPDPVDPKSPNFLDKIVVDGKTFLLQSVTYGL